jgi:hypothetical protein
MLSACSPLAGPATERRRSPGEIMELARLGAFWPTKFSFAHSFLRTVARIGFRCWVHEKALDEHGKGHIVYRACVAGETLTFVAFSDLLDESQQQDRIIADRWDAWAALLLGEASRADIEQSRVEIQKVVWGRAAPGTVVWSRANRSARLFEHVVSSLAAGRQPDPDRLNQVGYLIRTTGFSGNGRNGMLDFSSLQTMEHPLRAPYHTQMLAAYLWREFGNDLAMHLARVRDPRAVDLSDDIKRFIGVGNASGIGLVPFVVRHPRLVHRWIEVREQALAEVKAMAFPTTDPRCERMRRLVEGAIRYFRYEPQGALDEFESGFALANELAGLLSRLGPAEPMASANPVADLLAMAEREVSVEAQELLNALALELHDEGRVDANALAVDEALAFPAELRVGELRMLIRERFDWLARFGAGRGRPYFWYSSEENMEPRRGTVGLDAGEEYALPLDILGRLEELASRLEEAPADQSLGRFLFAHPDMRFMVGWVHTLARSPYAVARMDLLSPDFRPLRIMRFQLALYGMLKFRPRSTFWLCATLFQGAGLPHELAAGHPGDGLLPRIPARDV